MAEKTAIASEVPPPADWNVDEQSLMAATPAQRLAWLEEAPQLAYGNGALKPRRFLSQEEWGAMGLSPE